MDPNSPIGHKLEYIINHVFLPPKLPQQDDTSILEEVDLTKILHEALIAFIEVLPAENQDEWKKLSSMLSILLDDGNLGSPMRKLDDAIDSMEDGDVLALHITHQNAGLIIRKDTETYSFESFELLPSTRAVTNTKGRLIRRFPGPVIAVPETCVQDPDFRKAFTQLCSVLENETLDPALTKGCGQHRDTVNPTFVTEMPSGVLRGNGTPLDISRIFKRTRDDCLLVGDGFRPWRRSPRWTLLRVALQTTLMDPGREHIRYKIFMIYFMATILDHAKGADMSSDLLHVMLAKIHRRNRKLDTIIPNEYPWADQAYEYVTDTMRLTHEELSQRWSNAQKAETHANRNAELKELQPLSHTTLRLSNLKPFLRKLHNIELEPRNKSIFQDNCSLRIDGRKASLPTLDSSDPGSIAELRLCLMDLELWTSESLTPWFAQNIQPKRPRKARKALGRLTEVVEWYLLNSATAYAESPEGFSIRVLTVMSLWAALDKGVVLVHPLLKQFDPGFPPDFLDRLLLPKRKQMVQLSELEQYLLKRRENSRHPSSCIYSDVISSSCLGAQYFDRSKELQRLRRKIEGKAERESDMKRTEFKKAKADCAELLKDSNSLRCTEVTKMYGRSRNHGERVEHDPNCVKCSRRWEAQSMRISCQEWPLPSSEPAAKAVVFELGLPNLLRTWRSITYRILVDILNPRPLVHGNQKNFLLSQYDILANDLSPTSTKDRLQLASSTKPCADLPQYASLSVAEATIDRVCRPNNLKFFMQDAKSQNATSVHLRKYDLVDRVTFKLPPGPYATLQYVLEGTKHTSNEIIAMQASCPDGLTVHELHAFAALRSGHRLQWLNIARELVARNLDFGKEEVHLLLLQASWQAGPSALQQVSRDTHVELEEESYGHDLLSALEVGLASVRSNWQGSIAVLTFVSLAARLLSFSLHDSVQSRCLKFLQESRDVTIEWLRAVEKLLHDSSEEEETAYLTLRALDLALTCHCTFDVDAQQFFKLLESEDNLATLIEVCIIVNDRWPVSEEPLTTLTRELLRRFSRISHSLEDALKMKAISSPNGINKALKQIWNGYEPGTNWVIVQKPNDRWLTSCTAVGDSVHFNTLTGSLLINGDPLGRLPREYESHPTYVRLFGKKILGVAPSSIGLYFETRNQIYGQQIHFAMHGADLIVRASRGSDLYDLIPTNAIEDDFPRAFVEQYVHWMQKDTTAIEWRPLESRWISSPDNWRISTPEDPKASRLELKSRLLVELKSPTAKIIYKWLKPLDVRQNINIYWDADTRDTEVCLPRMNLDFIFRENTIGLRSKQFRGMVVDTNQYIGTLFGLKNKLVLKDTHSLRRIVLVPHGTVNYHRTAEGAQVTITTGLSEKVSYYVFEVDKQLGLLIDNGDLDSRLFKLYLHALTSHCLPDPLTSRTGTEEALHGLRLASTRSFIYLDVQKIELLKLFAKLTPIRDFYPKGSKFMQTVQWEDLSPLSHHEAFAKEAREMLKQAENFRDFHNSSEKTSLKMEHRGHNDLQQRAVIRNAAFRVHPYGAEDFTTDFDEIYTSSRDSLPKSKREREACHIAEIVGRGADHLAPHRDLLRLIMNPGQIVHGPKPGFNLNSTDAGWILPTLS